MHTESKCTAHRKPGCETAFTYQVHSFYFEFILNISNCSSLVSRAIFSVSDHGILHFFKSPSVKYNYTQIRQTMGKRFGRSPDKKKNGQQ